MHRYEMSGALSGLQRVRSMTDAQLDFHLPNQIELECIGEDGQPHRPVEIHRGVGDQGSSTIEALNAQMNHEIVSKVRDEILK